MSTLKRPNRLKKRSGNILLVSYYYPPYPFGGSLRIFYLNQFLKEHGWKTDIITSSDSPEAEYNVFDRFDSVTSNIRNRKNQLRAFNPMPDSMFLWSFSIARIIRKIHSNYDSIIITVPPFTAALAASVLLPHYIRKKIIIDIRDTWIDGPLSQYACNALKLIDLFWEHLTYSRFNRFVGVTEGIVSSFKSRSKKHISYIRNPIDKANARKRDKSDYIIYAGKVDHIRDNTLFHEIYGNMNDMPEIIFAGQDRNSRWTDYSYVNSVGSMDRDNMMEYIAKSRCGLILLSFDNENMYEIFPSKLLDYILCNTPVLYIGPRTIASDMIEAEGIGVAVTESDKNKIREGIEKMFSSNFRVNASIIDTLDYHSIFEKYLLLLNTANLNKGGP